MRSSVAGQAVLSAPGSFRGSSSRSHGDQDPWLTEERRAGTRAQCRTGRARPASVHATPRRGGLLMPIGYLWTVAAVSWGVACPSPGGAGAAP